MRLRGTPSAHLTIPTAFQLEGDRVDEGLLIRSVAIPWAAILREIERDPAFLSRLDWRAMEKLIAAAYAAQGFEVTLTDASGDLGRDVIVRARIPGLGSVLWYDQVKTFRADRRVELGDVREMGWVLSRDQNVSKGIITTTAKDFAPSVWTEFAPIIPNRLELVNGAELNKRILDLGTGR